MKQKHKGFREEIVLGGKKHLEKAKKAYFSKIEEFSKLSMDELKALYAPNDKILLGGIHRTALLAVINDKQRLEREEKLAIATDELGVELDSLIETTKKESNIEDAKIVGEGEE